MRVIAGKAKGRRLKVPKRKGVRPTSDYLREALFDILGSSVCGVRFLDLYAGSGAVGIEALSRGGAEVVFLEQDPDCLRVLRENVEMAGFKQRRVVGGDVLRVLPRLARQGEGFDIIFLDPPYGTGLARRTLDVVASGDLLRPRGVVIIEHFTKEVLPQGIGSLWRTREKTHGQTMLSFYGRTLEVER
ncbi:MAG: 16S rRNA (guanine(966)-N(2))-methyltransferase RsmD [candidate division NC10 bacterium]|nr:16S rRNA (guanine(966)-N(2))-methyltransferase RsmD [candidate division NC10 bacterium]MCH7895328.1 16S rRNA (guanine(966)-N(2))-methyltransferase RsmD [candidate division NC10 bacterium]MCZ6551506.1 16S rRNA (guanine(966)-N(2))-methyltransferase RsmD [candidate division NC10 bacterium]